MLEADDSRRYQFRVGYSDGFRPRLWFREPSERQIRFRAPIGTCLMLELPVSHPS